MSTINGASFFSPTTFLISSNLLLIINWFKCALNPTVLHFSSRQLGLWPTSPLGRQHRLRLWLNQVCWPGILSSPVLPRQSVFMFCLQSEELACLYIFIFFILTFRKLVVFQNRQSDSLVGQRRSIRLKLSLEVRKCTLGIHAKCDNDGECHNEGLISSSLSTYFHWKYCICLQLMEQPCERILMFRPVTITFYWRNRPWNYRDKQ